MKNFNTPVTCGICLKEFPSPMALSQHEAPCLPLSEAYQRVYEKVRAIPKVLTESERKDRSDLFDITLTVSMFLAAWGTGDERAIQSSVDLMADWLKAFNDRKSEENSRRKVA